MKAIIHNSTTDCFPTNKEVEELCCPGSGADTCVWLLMTPDGFECCCLNRHGSLYERWKKGETVAKRNGCDKVNNFSPMKYKEREIDF